MTQHTPGPWTVLWDEADGWNHHVYSSPTDRVCFMAHGGHDRQPEFDANARLIAAAPALLAALQEAERFLDYFANGHTSFQGGGTPRTALEQSRAAIAQATGEKP